MTTLSLLDRKLQDEEFFRLFVQEQLILDATEIICRAMERHGLNKTELAKRANISESHLTQLLSGSRDLTLRTLADLLFVMKERVTISSIERKGNGNARKDHKS